VLLGGDAGSSRFTAAVARRLVVILKAAHAARGMRVMLTPSRRTGPGVMQILMQALGAEDWVQIWNGREPNPYAGVLAVADRLIVTSESVSMVSEVLATGRPVHVLPLEGWTRRHRSFLNGLLDEGLVSLIEEDDLDWSFAGTPPIFSTDIPALRLRGLLEETDAV
jgi:mitochondrial fission protein ELM1